MISKEASMRRGKDKGRTLKMHWKGRDQQAEIILYTQKWLYQNITETTNQKTLMDTYRKEKAIQI